MARNLQIAAWLKSGCLLLGSFFLAGWSSVTNLAPTLQDIQIAGRVLHFRQPAASGEIVLAIVYDQAQPSSRDEAATLVGLLGNGLSVGDLVLRPRLVEQSSLAASTGYGAVFATLGVDDQLLAANLRQHGALCLTRHLEQVEHGACAVAICSGPSVSIVVNEANAAIASVGFATAFRMMVREI